MTQHSRIHDTDIRSHVEAELASTPGLDAIHIAVTVTDGHVHLDGRVASYPELRLAEEAGRRVAGVCDLTSEVTAHIAWGVKGDALIAAQANDALDRAIDIPAGPTHDVQASVNGGVLTLTGSVHWQFEREAAQRSVAYLQGVTEVRNEIQLRPLAPPIGVLNAIEAALARSSELLGQPIVVSASGGHVTLTGRVRTWTQLQQADAAAWSAPGVTSVSNLLHLEAELPRHPTSSTAG